MRLSARSQIKGRVVEVTEEQTTAHVRIDVGGRQTYAVIKASDVMVAVD